MWCSAFSILYADFNVTFNLSTWSSYTGLNLLQMQLMREIASLFVFFKMSIF